MTQQYNRKRNKRLKTMAKIANALQAASVLEDIKYSMPEKASKKDRVLARILTKLRSEGCLSRGVIMSHFHLTAITYQEVRDEFQKLFPGNIYLVKSKNGKQSEQWRKPETTVPDADLVMPYLAGRKLPERKRLPSRNPKKLA